MCRARAIALSTSSVLAVMAGASTLIVDGTLPGAERRSRSRQAALVREKLKGRCRAWAHARDERGRCRRAAGFGEPRAHSASAPSETTMPTSFTSERSGSRTRSPRAANPRRAAAT